MGKKLYIGNLPYAAGDTFLSETFSAVGTVVSARVMMDRDSGRSQGFGFVEMSTDDEARLAIEQFDGATCEGRQLKVMEAQPNDPRDNSDDRTEFRDGKRNNRNNRSGRGKW